MGGRCVVAIRPEIVLPTLTHCSKAYPNMENEYGVVCSFNPTFLSRQSGRSGWISKDHFALDQGLVILMIENYRTGLVWRLMRNCPYVVTGLRRAGFMGGWLKAAHRARRHDSYLVSAPVCAAPLTGRQCSTLAIERTIAIAMLVTRPQRIQFT